MFLCLRSIRSRPPENSFKKFEWKQLGGLGRKWSGLGGKRQIKQNSTKKSIAEDSYCLRCNGEDSSAKEIGLIESLNIKSVFLITNHSSFLFVFFPGQFIVTDFYNLLRGHAFKSVYD